MSETLVSKHPAAVQDVLQEAGMSRQSELRPAERTRAEAIASGQVQFETEDARRHFIMKGSGGRSNMARNGGPTKEQERLDEVLRILKTKRGKPMTRKELNEKAGDETLTNLFGADKNEPFGLGDVMSENATKGTVRGGYIIVREGRGQYAARKATAEEKAADKAAAEADKAAA